MTTASLLALAALSLIAAPGPGEAQDRRPRDPRPNFLFVFADDQRWDAMGVVQREQGPRGRFPWFQTPNMDRLAIDGIRFRNAFVVNALCSPSRACYLTGRYSHANGIVNNRTPFPEGSVTHASLLCAAGYATGYVGKWHMDNQAGKRPGFDFSASFIGHARYADAPFEVDGVKVATEGWVDDVSTDYALEFLQKSKEKPFLLVVGYKSPHGPFEPPARLKDRFAGAEAGAAPNEGSLPPFPRGNRPPETVQAANGRVPVNLNYFRCIAGVDENLGRLLTALDELGLAERTVVVYSSDNGFYLGEHGLGDKRSAYEESLRVPLLVRYPPLGARGRVDDRLVLNIDLAPTFLDFAGIPAPKEMQGRSWRPLLERKLEGKPDGKLVEWRRAFLYEYFFERGFFTPTVTAVRTASAKLIRYPGRDDWTELFDLETDPYETRNLAMDPARKELRDALQSELERQAKAVEFRMPEQADREADAEPPRKRAEAFVLTYDFSSDEGGRVLDASAGGHHGQAKAAPLTDGRAPRKARRFDGKGQIEVSRSPALDPSGGPWTVEAVVKAEGPEGVIVARGGASQGYALHLEGGRPVFSVRAGGKVSAVAAKEPIAGSWKLLAGVITKDQRLFLYVDGAVAAEGKLHAFIGRDPSDAMQVGTDAGSPVADYKGERGFVGLVESVRLFSGEREAGDIRRDSAAGRY